MYLGGNHHNHNGISIFWSHEPFLGARTTSTPNFLGSKLGSRADTMNSDNPLLYQLSYLGKRGAYSVKAAY